MLGWFDDEIRALLSDAIATGKLHIEADPQDAAALLQSRYPFEGAEPDWSMLCDLVRLDAESADRPGALEEFLTRWCEAHAPDADAPLLYVGRNLKHTVFALPVRALRAHMSDLFSYPQDAYVFPRAGDWILHSTRDDEVIGGVLPG